MPPTAPPPMVTPAPPKRAVGLTSGAFDFSLATPSPTTGKSKIKGKGSARAFQPLGVFGGTTTAAWQTPVKVEWDGQGERATPIRELVPARTDGSKITGNGLPMGIKPDHGVKEEADKAKKTPRKLTTLTSVSTPWAAPFVFGPGREPGLKAEDENTPGPSRKRKLGDFGLQLPPPRVKEEDKEDLGRRVALRQMGEGVRLDEIPLGVDQGKEDVLEKEVGWGISPRKGKIKWKGKGDPPLALRLNALLTTQSSSLTLFYTSLQHTLHPSHPRPSTSVRSPHPNRQKNNIKPEPPTPISPIDHIHSAPIRLRLIRPLSTREHSAQLWLASVRKWQIPPVSRLQIDDPFDGEEEEEEPPSEVIVNFAVAAKGAAGAGADIKVIMGRWWERQKAVEGDGRRDEDGAGREVWEVGVWSEWSVMDIPALTNIQVDGETELEDQIGTKRKILFASRYLIAART